VETHNVQKKVPILYVLKMGTGILMMESVIV
jgi:hypothetical protein